MGEIPYLAIQAEHSVMAAYKFWVLVDWVRFPVFRFTNKLNRRGWMSRNIGMTMKRAKELSNLINSRTDSVSWFRRLEAYPQKEEHWRSSPVDAGTHQWIVVIQKKPKGAK